MKNVLLIFAMVLLASVTCFAQEKKSMDIYDMTYLFESLPESTHNYNNAPKDVTKIWDHMHFIASLQGLANRKGVNLYVIFMGEEFGNDRNGHVDKYWLNLMTQKGDWLDGYDLNYVKSLRELIDKYKDSYKGLVVYDGNVYATSNAASTVAGVEDLLCVRYDDSEDSLFYYLTKDPNGPKIEVKRWLVNPDGSSKFTGNGTIPETDLKSTGSPKCDVYMWAKTKYLDTGKCDPQMLAYYIDSYWIKYPYGRISWNTLTNHDYFIMNKGFFFDLSPWDDETPIDDRNQPIGTDYNTLKEILYSAHRQNKGEVYGIAGFVPWDKKYSNYGNSGGTHVEVAGEWKYAEIISCFNGYMDADALGGMANASIFTQFPLKEKYTQKKPAIDDLKKRGLIDENGKVKEATYVYLYAGDYDAGAWLYEKQTRIWIDQNRGNVAMNWAFNPNTAKRFAYGMDYYRKTATENDIFTAGDNGAGYLNPSLLSEPRPHSDLPSGVDAWRRHNKKWMDKFDLSVIGFVIDGNAPMMNEELWDVYAEISPDGFVMQKSDAHDGVYKGVPYIRHEDTLIYPNNDEEAFIKNTVKKFGRNTPDFYMFRHVLWAPTGQMDFMDKMEKANGNKIEYLDAHSFFLLLKYFHESGQTPRYDIKGNVFDYTNIDIIAHSPTHVNDDIRNMFFGSFNCVEINNIMFADGSENGFTAFVEWKTKEPVSIKRFIASPNGTNGLRDISAFRLFGKDESGNWVKIGEHKTETVPFPINTEIKIDSPILADTYKIEFDQRNAGNVKYGIRIEEIEGYLE